MQTYPSLVPAKYPLKDKLENVHNFGVLELR